MKYKVGDKVKIHGVTDHRSNYNGKEVTIKSIYNHTLSSIKEPAYSVGEIYYFFESELEPVNTQKIVITSDGKETLARLYEGEKVVKKATAQCSPDDTFDFKTGAMLAFERLMNEGKWRVVHRKPKVGDYIRIKHNDYPPMADVGDILKADAVSNDIVSIYNKNMPRPSKKASDAFCWNYRFDEIEVVEPANSAVEEKPKYYNGKAVCTETKPQWAYTVGKVYEFKDGRTVIDNGRMVYTSQPVKSIEEWNELYGHYAKMLEIVE